MAKKRKNRQAHGQRMMEMLCSFAEEMDRGMSPLIRPWAHLRYGAATHEILEKREQRLQYEAYLRLLKRHWIKQHKRAKKAIVELTDVGRQILLKQRIVNCERKLSKGKLCYVSFDFPERERAARNVFRDFLHQAQFRIRHQSLWVTEMNIVDDLRVLIRKLKITDWVEVILTMRK